MARATSLESIKKLSMKMPSGCIHFTGPICKRTGYGRIGFKGSVINAHRVTWILTFGPIPEGLHVCHTCDNRKCINIDHLFLGTPKDNTLDMIKKGRWRPRGSKTDNYSYIRLPRTHCSGGHELTPENTYLISTRENTRVCRLCRSIENQVRKLIKSIQP